MKKFFISLIIVLLYYLPNSNAQGVQVKVNKDEKLSLENLKLTYRENCWGDLIGFQPIEAEKDEIGRAFSFDIKNQNKIAYFSLFKNLKIGSINIISDFVAVAGDDIKIHIVKDSSAFNGFSLSFSGKGSAKFECQYELSKTLAKITKLYYIDSKYNYKGRSVMRDSIYYNYFPIQLEWQIKASTETYKANLAILNKYKSRISDFMFNLLKAQIYAELEDSNITYLTYPYTTFKDRSLLPNYLGSIDESLINIYNKRFRPDFKKIPELYLALSDKYLRFGIKKAADTIIRKGDNFRYITENFKGILRDRLMTAYFSSYFFLKKDADKNLEKALKSVKTDYCREILLTFNSALRPGNWAYNFELPDSSGKIIKLSDFKGKVVLMDFWFTGCSNCRTLTTHMKPIVKQFDNNQNIVFISVNIDKDIQLWKKSLKSGEYSHNNSIDLSTEIANGKGIIEYYKIYGYPTVLLIDKKGKIITANPPRPDNSRGVKDLLTLITTQIDIN